MPDETGSHPVMGRAGPTQAGLLYKKSDSGEFRPRYFELKSRRLNFWADDELIDSLSGYIQELGQIDRRQHRRVTQTVPKGYRDPVGATIRSFEECCAGPNGPRTNWYGIEIIEEYGARRGAATAQVRACVERGDFGSDSPLYKPGESTMLFHHEVEARDLWLDALTFAKRPSWVADDDPRANSCMESQVAFSFMDRRHHCRQCGGVFRRSHLLSQPLPDLAYDSPVWVCRPCVEGTKPAGRWDSRTKVNTGERGPRGAVEQVGNIVKDLWRAARTTSSADA